MSNVNQNAARVPVAAGSTPSDAVSIAARKLADLTYYYMLWVALGMADTYEEWVYYMMPMDDMECLLGYEYLGDIINMCED